MTDLRSHVDASGDGWRLIYAMDINDKGWITGTMDTGVSNGGRWTFILKPTNVTQMAADRVHFQTDTKTPPSLWGPVQGAINYELPLVQSWDVGGSVGGYFNPCFGPWDLWLVTIPRVCLGDFGARATLGTKGQAGLKFSAYVDAGSVNLSYPLTMKLQFPDKDALHVGDSFKVKASYVADRTATLSTTSPRAGASLDAIFQAQNTARLEAKAFGNTLLDRDFVPERLRNINYNYNIFNFAVDSSTIGGKNFSLFNGILTGSVRFPRLATSGGLDLNEPAPRTLRAHAGDSFLSARGSITNLITSFLGFPLSYHLDTDLPGGHLTADLAVLQLYYQGDFRLEQEFSFLPKPRVKLQLDQPVNWTDPQGGTHQSATIDFEVTNPAGTEFQMTIPGTSLQLAPTYTLGNTFTNRTSVVVDQSLTLEPLKARASGSVAGWNLGGFDYSLGSYKAPFGSTSFSLLNKSFELPRIPAATAPTLNLVAREHAAPTLDTATVTSDPVGGAMRDFAAKAAATTRLATPGGTRTLSMVAPRISVMADPGETAPASGGQLPMWVVNQSEARTTSWESFRTLVNSTSEIALHGTSFRSGATVRFLYHGASVDLATTYVSPIVLKVQFPNRLRLLPGVGRFVVTNPNSTGPSNTLDFTIAYPKPEITIPDGSVWASDPHFRDLLVRVAGVNFINRPDYYWSENQNPIYEGRLLQKYWNLAFPSDPKMAAYFPQFPCWDTDAQGAALPSPQTAPLPTVYWNGEPLARYVEPAPTGGLPSLLPNAAFATAHVATLEVENPGPGGGRSGKQYVLIGAPRPELKPLQPSTSEDVPGLEPATATPGDAGFRLVVRGVSYIPTKDESPDKARGFVADSVVCWNGQPRPTKFISPTELQAEIPASDLTGSREANEVTVRNPWRNIDSSLKEILGEHVSSPLTFTVRNPVPQIESLAPQQAVTADPAFDADKHVVEGLSDEDLPYNLTVRGTGFTSRSVVNWNGQPRPTRFVSDALLQAVLSPADVAAPGDQKVKVVTPAAGTPAPPAAAEQSSNEATFKITNPAPELAKVSPGTAIARPQALRLLVEGKGFCPGSVVQWNGTSIATTFRAEGLLEAEVPAEAASASGQHQVTVVNPAPGGGTSSALPVTLGGMTVTASAASATVGETLSVSWTAPVGASYWDWIGLFRKDDPNTGEVWYAYTTGMTSGNRTLAAPNAPGIYEFRYLLNNGRTDVARSAPIEVKTRPSSDYTLTPSVASGGTIVAGAPLSVQWTAPAGSPAWDWIGLFPVSDPNAGEMWWNWTWGAPSGTHSLNAPLTPGEYEFRYLLNNGRLVLKTSTRFTVQAPSGDSYSLTPSATDVAAGGALSVTWKAPAGTAYWDWIGLFKVGDPNTAERWYTYTSGAAEGTRSLTAPLTPGTYEFRYFPNNGRSDVKRSAPITVR